MMKKLLSLLLIAFAATQLVSQDRATFTSIASGDWNDGATWDQAGATPGSSDDVVIGSGFTVTSATSGDAAGSIAIGSTATLTISSGATLTASGSASISGTLNQNGTLNIGDAVDDMFHINGGTFAVGNGSTTTIAGYFKQEYVDASNVGTISATSGITATINVANAGELSDNVNNIFYFDDDCISALTGATVNINILNGNSGTADEVVIGIASGISPGNGTVKLGNGSSTVSDWSMINNSSYGRVELDIGAANTLNFSHTVDRATTTVVFNGLTVTSGTFLIESTAGLHVTNNNALSVGASGSIVLASDASGTGELLFSDDADDVTATVQRFIVGDEWHQITPTTTSATANDVFQNYSPNVHLQEWVEGTQSFEFITSLSENLNVGQGYMVKGTTLTRANDFTISYTGNMESSDFAVAETLGSEEFTLVGNPFSTAVRVIYDGFGMQDNVGLVDQIWIWDGANNQYATSTGATGGTIPNGVVAQGQGFFVRSLTGWTGPVGMTIREDQRQFSNPSYFLKATSEIDWSDNHGKGEYVMVKVTDGNKQDGAFVNFGEYGTPGFEQNYDGMKSFGYATSPQLYLVEEGLNLTIDYLKTLEEAEERVVKLNLKPAKNGQHKMAANLDSLLSVKVTLEDTKTGAMHEFNTGEHYTFNATTADAADRFLLHFMYNPLGIEDPIGNADESNFNIYAYGKAVYITNSDNTSDLSSVLMYDVMGREVYSNKVELGSNTRIPVNVSNTYLIVKIINGKEVVTQKVFIQ